MKILNNGSWEGIYDLPHGTDKGLAKELARFLNAEVLDSPDELYPDGIHVIDIGCGDGYYTRYLNNFFIICEGYDGNPFTDVVTEGQCGVADFSIKQDLGLFHWTLSLEVGEHIPAEFEDIFISNLDRHNTEGIILSWSIPEFGGDGHVNPHTNEYIINKITSLGYTLDQPVTNLLRYSCAKYPEPCWWFSKTIFCFRRIK